MRVHLFTGQALTFSDLTRILFLLRSLLQVCKSSGSTALNDPEMQMKGLQSVRNRQRQRTEWAVKWRYSGFLKTQNLPVNLRLHWSEAAGQFCRNYVCRALATPHRDAGRNVLEGSVCVQLLSFDELS